MFGDHHHYEARRSGLSIYNYEGTTRRTVHTVAWTSVTRWLNMWTGQDRHLTIELERERFHLEHSPEDLAYNPAWTIAEAHAIAARRDARMAAGDRDKIRDLTERIRTLTDRYLTGDRAPARQEPLF